MKRAPSTLRMTKPAIKRALKNLKATKLAIKRASSAKRLRICSGCQLTSASTDSPNLASEGNTNTSQHSINSAMTIISWLSMNMMACGSNSLLRTELIVAVGDQATTGPPFKSASHRFSSKRSRSGITQLLTVYVVSSSIPRTVQLC